MGSPYNYQHRQRRSRLMPAALGTPCPLQVSPRCVGLMTNPRHMELDHSTPLILGGTVGDRIVCASCNRSAGATLGNQLRGARQELATEPTQRRRRTRSWRKRT